MQTIAQILDIFQGYRMAPTPNDVYEAKGKKILEDKLFPYVASGDVINFVMLGFPFKSTNQRDKVIGTLPDAAEQATLDNFAAFNRDIQKAYAPGVQITIVSDGAIFNDLLGVTDRLVEQYNEISMDMGRNAPMTWYSLADFYSGRDLNGKRERVVSQFGITEEKLQQEILLNPDVNFLYRGMIRFMNEELADKGFSSNSQVQKHAKALTRQMMFRNEAYSNLVRSEFPNHIRLSMHPSINSGEKYSFKLLPGEHAKYSAWHAALLKTPTELQTIHRKDAEEAGYRLVLNSEGRPFYFIQD